VFSSGFSYTLPSDIPAIQILPSLDGKIDLSPVSMLPQGAELSPCGKGFDLQTVKVRCHGHYYYVFLRDLQEKDPIVSGLN
jgi:hypothetical protein